MISFEPLKQLMKKRGINQSKLSEMTGIENTRLSLYFKNKVIARTDVIENICNVLECDIDDVICYSENEKKEDVNVKWDYLEQQMKNNGLSFRALSLSLGRSEHYLQNKRDKSILIEYSELENIAALLNCVTEDLVEIQ